MNKKIPEFFDARRLYSKLKTLEKLKSKISKENYTREDSETFAETCEKVLVEDYK